MPPKDKYTDPKLRDQVKEEIQQSDKGGEPGQWSARKAQMMAKEYKKRGGDYNTDKSEKDKSQQNLSNWGDEEWQTKDGSGEAKQEDGSRKRYLPKKAWEQMDEKEKKQTDDKKQEESKEGKQYVGNTSKAKKARKNARKGSKEQEEDGKEDFSHDSEDSGAGDSSAKENDSPSPSRKRTRGQQSDEGKKGGQKKQKSNSGEANKSGTKSGTVGSKHDSADAPAKPASLDRLPKKGQKAHWKALPGWVDGEVIETVKTQKKVDGKDVKGSKDDPKIVLKSAKSGKICVHNVGNVYFD